MYGDPSLIVLDEPNSNLDDIGEQALLAAIMDLHKRGKTIVLITHRTSIITATSKLLFLREGSMQMFGPTNQVLAELAKQQQQVQQAIQTKRQALEQNVQPAPSVQGGPQ